MSLNENLHKLLIGKQTTAELLRKRKKASRKAIWTQEDIDAASREGLIMALKMKSLVKAVD